jgi:predicted lipid-binding transport protein (Tim44 family)
MRNERYHQQPRQHGDTLLDQPVYQPPPVYYPYPAAPELQYRRPSLVAAFVGGMVGFVLGIFRVLGHLFMVGVAGLLILGVLGVGALVGIHKLTVWANDHQSTTTTTSAP